MVAHAFAESSGKWKDSKDDFKASTDLNVFNLQGVEGTAGSHQGERWEYLPSKLKPEEVDRSIKITVNNVTKDAWPKFVIEKATKVKEGVKK